jgi:hypothetical protein
MIPIRNTVPQRNRPITTSLIRLINCLVFLFGLTMHQDVLVKFLQNKSVFSENR